MRSVEFHYFIYIFMVFDRGQLPAPVYVLITNDCLLTLTAVTLFFKPSWNIAFACFSLMLYIDFHRTRVCVCVWIVYDEVVCYFKKSSPFPVKIKWCVKIKEKLFNQNWIPFIALKISPRNSIIYKRHVFCDDCCCSNIVICKFFVLFYLNNCLNFCQNQLK